MAIHAMSPSHSPPRSDIRDQQGDWTTGRTRGVFRAIAESLRIAVLCLTRLDTSLCGQRGLSVDRVRHEPECHCCREDEPDRSMQTERRLWSGRHRGDDWRKARAATDRSRRKSRVPVRMSAPMKPPAFPGRRRCPYPRIARSSNAAACADFTLAASLYSSAFSELALPSRPRLYTPWMIAAERNML